MTPRVDATSHIAQPCPTIGRSAGCASRRPSCVHERLGPAAIVTSVRLSVFLAGLEDRRGRPTLAALAPGKGGQAPQRLVRSGQSLCRRSQTMLLAATAFLRTPTRSP